MRGEKRTTFVHKNSAHMLARTFPAPPKISRSGGRRREKAEHGHGASIPPPHVGGYSGFETSRRWAFRRAISSAVGHCLCVLLLIAFGQNVAGSAPAWWPQFRGPHGSGIADNSRFPTQFGPDSNVVWKTVLPSGNGSPCVWENRIFLTGSAAGKLLTLCLDRRTGAILWQRELSPEKTESNSGLGSLANSTPATDGQIVCVYFGSYGLAAYQLEGQELWRKPLPIPITQHGAGTSPILAGGLALLLCDQDVGSYLLAVDKHTGNTVWKADRTAFRRSFSTPLAYPPAAPEMVIATGTLRLMAYNLKDGSERWSVSGLPNEMVSSPITDGDLVYAAGWTYGSGPGRLPSYDNLLAQSDANHDDKIARGEATSGPARQHFQYIDADKDEAISRVEWESIAAIFQQSQNVAFAVRPDGHGNVTQTHVVWKQTRGLPYVPSPLNYDGRVYLVKNGGMLTCLEARTGHVFYREERLGALGNYYASPVADGGKICVISQQGMAVVIRSGDTLEVLARNKLGEEVLATPAIVDDALYVRTKKHCYAFRE